MSVTEYERNQLFAWFEEHMGSERAATMMNLLPPVGWGDVATKRDLDRLDAKFDAVDARFDAVDAKFDAVDARFRAIDTRFDAVDARFDAVDARFDALDVKIGTVDAKVDSLAGQMATKADLAELTSDIQRTFVTWMFAAQATVVAAVGLLLAFVR